MMRHLLLLTPNSSHATSAMMQANALVVALGEVAMAVAMVTREPPKNVTH